MKKREIIFVLCVFIAAVISYIMFNNGKKNSDTVIIYADGKKFCEKSLYTDCIIEVNGTNSVEIKNGSVYMVSASCPDKLCIGQGRISDSSKKIICLPNRVIVEVTKKSDIDTVVK